MRQVIAAGVILAMTTAAAVAVDPDRVRDEARPPPPPPVTREQSAAALSDAFKKFSSSHMLAWKLSVSGNLMIMGQFSSAKHCAEARKMLRRQVVRYGWGRAECLEVMLP
jgi:hypothetical protein